MPTVYRRQQQRAKARQMGAATGACLAQPIIPHHSQANASPCIVDAGCISALHPCRHACPTQFHTVNEIHTLHSALSGTPAFPFTRIRCFERCPNLDFTAQLIQAMDGSVVEQNLPNALGNGIVIHDGGSWQSLGPDMHRAILTVLQQRKDKDSMQAIMQTSRGLRLIASSLISRIDVYDARALACFPKFAALTSMRLGLMLRTGGAELEPYALVAWLQATSAVSNRLETVTDVLVILMDMDAVTLGSLIESLARACPNLRSLHIGDIDRQNENLVVIMLMSIGLHFPRLTELRLELDASGLQDRDYNFNIAGINWAGCLPRGLQKFRSSVHLHHELLQQLAQMPSLTDVTVWSLYSLEPGQEEEERREVQSHTCAWKKLDILGDRFPTHAELCSFTAWPQQLRLFFDRNLEIGWTLDAKIPYSRQCLVVETAADRLSHCLNPSDYFGWDDFSLGWGQAIPDTASAVGFVSALAPMRGLAIPRLTLDHWPVTDRTLDELVMALPFADELTLVDCSISSGAWLRMLSLTPVTHLCLVRTPVPLAQVVAFASAVSRPMVLRCLGSTDQPGWDDFQGALMEQRRLTCLPLIEVIVIS